MPGENLLCLAGPVRATAVIVNFLCGLVAVFYVVIWASHRHSDFNTDQGCRLGGNDRYEPDSNAVPIVVFHVISFFLYMAMALEKMRNYPAFFRSVSASLWTILSHVFVLFLVPFLSCMMYLGNYLGVDAVISLQSRFNAGNAYCYPPFLIEFSRVWMILGMTVSGVQFVLNVIIFWYTLNEVAILL